MLPLLRIDRALEAQRGHLLPWVPVCLGFGIGVFFLLRQDPGYLAILLLAAGLCLSILLYRLGENWSILALALVLVCLGFVTAWGRTVLVEAPVLQFRYFGSVEGRVIALDRSGTGALRLTLDQPRLTRLSLDRTPARVKISLISQQTVPPIGAYIGTTAHLMPPQGPSEPGGFDFRRHAWFQKLGANGYTRNPIVVLQPPAPGLSLQRIRADLSQVVQARLGPDTGGVAAAVITGDRSGLRLDTVQSLRASNLAHLLAISGLHMGLLSGVVFGALRLGLCLIPPLALRCNVKKIAALAALVAAIGYLGLSGGNVATERAFIMVLVVLVAVLLDRRAFSLRSVAIAATLVLLRRPETLLSPGFQMSFAATTALICVFGWLRDSQISLGPTWFRPFVTVLISSAVAGLATAPFGAAHFNTLSHYGLLANVLAVPVMGAIVVPAIVLSFCLWGFGLEGVGFWLLDIGLRWILAVAEWVSLLPNSQSGVISPDPCVLPLLTCAGLFIALWQGRFRWWGLPVMAMVLWLWGESARPLVLISANGGLIGILTADGRALSRYKSQEYTAKSWLARDGDQVSQARAAERWPDRQGNGSRRQVQAAGYRVMHVIGKGQAAELRDCKEGDLIVAMTALDLSGSCIQLQPSTFQRSGSVLIRSDGTLISANQIAGDRPWSRRKPPPIPPRR